MLALSLSSSSGSSCSPRLGMFLSPALVFFFFLSTVTVVATAKAPTTSGGRPELPPLVDETYTFERYKTDFDKMYASAEEDALRRQIFQNRLAVIVAHNQENKQRLDEKEEENRRRNGLNMNVASGGGGYWQSVNDFTDLEASELPKGYVKPATANVDRFVPQSAATTTTMTQRRHRALRGPFESQEPKVQDINNDALLAQRLGLDRIDAVADLPQSMDWRSEGVTTPIKNQGHCGSCWAFATTAVLESHVAITTGHKRMLSVQQLVSCVPNNRRCGGTGGCGGATAELALDFVHNRGGMWSEWEFGYQSYHGDAIECPNMTAQHRHPHPVAHIGGWTTLPRNNYTVVMNVLAKLGPLTVSVACDPWMSYHSGVFEGNFTTKQDSDVNHLVALEGYGTDEETGEDYWLVRNSWGPEWGEEGYIRLLRMDPAAPSTDTHSKHNYCGVDVTPDDGIACTVDPDGHEVQPPNAKVCGTSGILYDVALPLAVY